MPSALWEGRRWQVETPKPTAALVFAKYVEAARADAATALDELLLLLLGEDQLDELYEGMATGEYAGRLNDLVNELVLAASGRPVRAVATLCVSTLKSWSTIQGRLVMSGTSNPLRDLPSLWALINVTESMVLESKQTAEERTRYLSQMYPETAKKGVRDWSDEEEAASWDAFMGAL